MVLNNQRKWIKKNQKIDKKQLEANENQIPKLMECNKCSSKWKAHSNQGLHQETRDILNKQLQFTPKGTNKEVKSRSTISRRKKIKIIVEINKVQTKNKIKLIDETKSRLFKKINKFFHSVARLTKKKRENSNK